TIITPPSVYSAGQQITLLMTISNTGATNAVNVSPEMPLTRIGVATATLANGPMPASALIPAGSGATFTFIYNAGGAGSLAFYGRAAGYDERTSVTYYSVTDTSNSITVESPASLTSSIVIDGSTLNVGQQVMVRMIVQNTGLADALNVQPSTLFITLDSTGGMIPPIGPVPVSQNIPGNTTAEFTWTFSATARGVVTLSGNASGTDENSGLIVSSAYTRSNTVTIQDPASIAINIWAEPALPAIVKTGQDITVYMAVTNTGEAAISGVTPSALTLNNPAIASLRTGPVPVSFTSIPGGTVSYFAWIYRTTASGTLNFQGYAHGWDKNLSTEITSSTDTSNDVQIADSAYLSASVSISQLVVSTNQDITV
ncbi:MAG TPA: hypothetical protein PLF61_07375, partial [Candidatus Goldiibacteriota bacterium]|nr:hypothetical protein [Candidatus Goldiibacteriota bacterium]